MIAFTHQTQSTGDLLCAIDGHHQRKLELNNNFNYTIRIDVHTLCHSLHTCIHTQYTPCLEQTVNRVERNRAIYGRKTTTIVLLREMNSFYKFIF